MRWWPLVSGVVVIAACGHGEPPPSAAPASAEPPAAQTTAGTPRPTNEAPRREHASPGIQVEGDVGGLNPDDVNAVMKAADPAINRCWERGADRNELVAGKIDLVLGVGESGRLAYGYAKQTTLGDRMTERCMLDALRAQSWPKPVGGRVGVVKTSLVFELGKDARPPTSWSSAEASEVRRHAADAIAACKHGATGTFTATVYVKQVEQEPPDAGADAGDDAGDAGPTYAGAATSVGIAVPDEHADAIADCLERVLSQGVYPAPGDWPAKVTFAL